VAETAKNTAAGVFIGWLTLLSLNWQRHNLGTLPVVIHEIKNLLF